MFAEGNRNVIVLLALKMIQLLASLASRNVVFVLLILVIALLV